MNEKKLRARNAMFGLAIGNSISWTSMYYRSAALPFWTRRIRREIEAASETENILLHPMPFSLNQSVEHFDLYPTAVVEWTTFASENILKSEGKSFTETARTAWLELSKDEASIKGTVGIKAALKNLSKGISSPRSGKENPHYFDDSALTRVIPIGLVCGGLPEEAASLAKAEAEITNYEDGVWAAQAAAVFVSLLCDGKNIETAIDVACKYLPENSWVRRVVNEALSYSENCKSVFDILPLLNKNIVNPEYSYGNIAPETLALALVITKIHLKNFQEAVSLAACFPKCAESLPALVGAFAGACTTEEIASETWLNSIRYLKGISIPNYADKNFLEVVDKLIQLDNGIITV